MNDEAQNMIAIFTTDDGKLQEDRKSALQRVNHGEFHVAVFIYVTVSR